MRVNQSKPIKELLIKLLEARGYTVVYLNLEHYNDDLDYGTLYYNACIEKEGVVYDQDFEVSDSKITEHRKEVR